MNILVIGSGGREHAVIKSIKKNPAVETIYCLPGNGGIAADATCVNIGAKDIDGIVRFASENKIDYAVVTPDDPLVLGCVDALEEKGIPCRILGEQSVDGIRVSSTHIRKLLEQGDMAQAVKRIL